MENYNDYESAFSGLVGGMAIFAVILIIFLEKR